MAQRRTGKPTTILSGGIRSATVQVCIDYLPADERALMERLREFILGEAPEPRERLSYNVLVDPSGYVEKGSRKQVYWLDPQQFTRTDERMLAQLLAQAIARDQAREAGLR